MFAAVTYSDLIVKKIEGLVTYNDERTLWIVLTVVFAVVGYLIGSLNVSILYSPGAAKSQTTILTHP